MADYIGEDAELQKLNNQVLADPEDFEKWKDLVQAVEAQENGIGRNSSPTAIAAFRQVYDRFLARFPLFFGYWNKYADLEFTIGGTEAAEMVYERGVASIGNSVDLWTGYCQFKTVTTHDADVIREYFERGAESVGLDYQAYTFWDKYLEFEERSEAPGHTVALLARLVQIAQYQHGRYFERFRGLAPNRPLAEFVPEEQLEVFRKELKSKQTSGKEAEAELRTKVDNYFTEIFNRVQQDVNKRWAFEAEIKRPYYHVTELEDGQLVNWRKYLEFEEAEGDYVRTKFLYERCLVTCANHEEFWLRYSRWMMGHADKQEELRSIYQRASCIYVSITEPSIRYLYAQFEESEGRAAVAADIYEAILMQMPNHTETIVALANLYRRQYGLEAAAQLLKKYISSPACSENTIGALVSEWARMVWKVRGNADEARQIYQAHQAAQQNDPECATFWTAWLEFELQQPTSESTELAAYKRVKALFDTIRKTRLSPYIIRGLSAIYLGFLKERGGKDAMKEYVLLDSEINGPSVLKTDLGENVGQIAPSKSNGNLAAAQQQHNTLNGMLSMVDPA